MAGRPWSDDVIFQRRQEFAHEFKDFDVDVFAAFLKRKKVRSSVVTWQIKAVQLAKSGFYYMAEIAPILEKHYVALARFYGELRALRGVEGTGWPTRPKDKNGVLRYVDGEWSVENGDVAADFVRDSKLHVGGQHGPVYAHTVRDGDAVRGRRQSLEPLPHVCVLRRAEWRVLREAVASGDSSSVQG